ncbi:MAG: alpha-D-glucose phosphate-specific phosphoglucomutase, partial [Burkholderiaceae bacterium]|nr:alpha-D-glucose phosphate-specific phosphoglucomutase [Burkholderiaceae bacterium]
MKISPLAGTPAPKDGLIDVARLVAAYYSEAPDPSVPEQRVAFGTSGHRGSSLEKSFNESHVLAISQAICQHRKRQRIGGPLFVGIDTHALSVPAFESALEVLAANGVEVLIARDGEYTPTPAVSHAILAYNRGRKSGLADGIVITPSHNPPDSGGFKYNPPNGGPADADVTGWIEASANALLEADLKDVRRTAFDEARRADTTREHDFLGNYVADLDNVIDFAVIRDAGIRIGVDPLGGAGVHYWARIAERYHLDLTVVSDDVDPTFAFMSLDWDGRIRMDPSSEYAMQRLIGLKDRYDIAFSCDTDHDRHGVVAPSAGLLPSNHYLSVAIDYLFRNRPCWSTKSAVGKTVASSALIDRVAARVNRQLYEMPVGFKWFVDGLFDGSLAFAGEESAGASFSRIDGSVWTTDKDGIASALLAAEITARTGRDPGELYRNLTRELGEPAADRVEAKATPEQKRRLAKLSPQQLRITELAGEPVDRVLDRAPGNDAPIGGIKVIA